MPIWRHHPLCVTAALFALGPAAPVGAQSATGAIDGQRNTQPNDVVLSIPGDTPRDPLTLAGVEMLEGLAQSWTRKRDQDVFLIKTDHELEQIYYAADLRTLTLTPNPWFGSPLASAGERIVQLAADS